MLKSLQGGLWTVQGGVAWCQGTQLEMWWTAAASGVPVSSWLLLHEGFKAQLQLIAQIKKHLVDSMGGEGLYDLAEWGGFHGGI